MDFYWLSLDSILCKHTSAHWHIQICIKPQLPGHAKHTHVVPTSTHTHTYWYVCIVDYIAPDVFAVENRSKMSLMNQLNEEIWRPVQRNDVNGN